MAKTKQKAEDRPQTPQGSPDPETEENFKLNTSPEPAATTGEPSKMDAVREALAEGFELPEEGTTYVKSKYGFEMSRQMFSTYKANIKRKESGGHTSGARVPAANGDMFAILQGMKALVLEHGADRVKEMVDLVS